MINIEILPFSAPLEQGIFFDDAEVDASVVVSIAIAVVVVNLVTVSSGCGSSSEGGLDD